MAEGGMVGIACKLLLMLYDILPAVDPGHSDEKLGLKSYHMIGQSFRYLSHHAGMHIGRRMDRSYGL